MQRTLLSLLLATASAAFAQTGAPMKLTLQEAEALALKSHPQVLAAQNVASAIGRQVVEARSADYPAVAGDITGSGANQQTRIGAGFLTDSRIFNRFGQGININQLVTDSGRTSNLIASARLRASAAGQTYAATRYDVLLRVNQAYFGALRAQAIVKVAQETVAARQLIVDQITALARNNLRSQLDVTFVDVSLSQAKLLLIQAQDQELGAYAELTRALGAERNATYAPAEEPLPPSPPQDPEALVTEAIGARPEVQNLRLEAEAAARFERAERDLSYPTVTLVGVGGYIPFIDQIRFPA